MSATESALEDTYPSCGVLIGLGVNRKTRVGFFTESDVTSSKSDEHISGIAKHARHCPNCDIDWDNPEILATYNDKNKAALQRNLLVGESLKIRQYQTSTGSGLNDPQLCVRSNAWDPILSII